ncbi:hypothetical protein DFH06DRAFT_439152 [Mycena polygramma]|nr:hypothetical protein DFH06DRAFT_439152 [Mycena polygramma]
MLASLEADRARVKAIEAQIADIKQSISALLAEQTLARERIESYKYPVLTLPNEIMSEIFMHLLPQYPLCPPLTGNLSPHLLLRVCRKWRDIALSTPILWRAILVEKTIPDCDPLRRRMTDNKMSVARGQASRVKSWLDRSGRLPLSIQIVEYEFLEEDILRAIVPHHARWEYVSLHNIRLNQLLPVEGPMSLLRQLEIRAPGNISTTMAFPAMPQLRTATLWNFYYSPALLPWSQLTSLTLIGKHPHECVSVLSHASNLRYCELAMFGGDWQPPTQPDISLPHLESLVLVPWSKIKHFPDRYLLCFLVPALRRLQVPELGLGSDPIATLTSFISSSGCKLEELRITGEPNPRAAYLAAFPSIPNIAFDIRMTDWHCYAALYLRARARSVANFQS